MDFSANTVTESSSDFIDTGDAPPSATDTPLIVAPKVETPSPAAPGDEFTTTPEEAPTEIAPLPDALQPAPKPHVNPLTAMAEAMRLAHANESDAQIAKRVADALATPEAAEPEAPAEDPDRVELSNISTRLEALQQQASEEGTSDYDADIAALSREQLKLEARLEVRDEIQSNQEAAAFVQQASGWDNEADRAFPETLVKGSPLDAAVTARVDAIKRTDPDYFNRSPDAGFNLVAAEAAKLGIAPRPRQVPGTVPTPQTPQAINAPSALPGSVQVSHRPGDSPPQSAGQKFISDLLAAEKGGFAAELALSKQFSGGNFAGVAFAS